MSSRDSAAGRDADSAADIHADRAADLARWRDEFPITEQLIYLNNCSLTPLPKRGAAALGEFGRTWTELGGRAWFERGAQAQGWELRCPIDPAQRTPIVTLAHPDPGRAVAALRAEGCIVDYRPGIIRLSPHHFNTAAEIDRTLELLAAVRETIPA